MVGFLRFCPFLQIVTVPLDASSIMIFLIDLLRKSHGCCLSTLLKEATSGRDVVPIRLKPLLPQRHHVKSLVLNHDPSS
jgi:hypothetical protein